MFLNDKIIDKKLLKIKNPLNYNLFDSDINYFESNNLLNNTQSNSQFNTITESCTNNQFNIENNYTQNLISNIPVQNNNISNQFPDYQNYSCNWFIYYKCSN